MPTYDMFGQLAAHDKAQAIGNATIDTLALKEAFQKGSGRRAYTAAPKILGRTLLPLMLGAEAIQNTKNGWGKSIEAQRARVGDSNDFGFAEGLANPLTTLANAGQSIYGLAASEIDANFSLPHAVAQMKQQQKFNAWRRSTRLGEALK